MLLRQRLLSSVFGGANAAPNYYIGAAGSDPKVVADFAGVKNNGEEYYRKAGVQTTFDNLFSYTGGMSTMTDSDGNLKWCPHNIFTYSADFTNAAWNTGSASVTKTAGGDADPDGDASFVITPSTSTGSKYMRQLFTPPYTDTYTCQVVAKANGYNFIAFGTQSANYVYFNLSTGSVGTTGISWTNASMTDLGNGWYLCSGNVTRSATSQYNYIHVAEADNTISFTGDGTSGVLMSKPRFFRSSLGGMVNNPDRGDSYVPTTSTAVYLPRRNHYRWTGAAYEKKGVLVESAAATNIANSLGVWTQTGAVRTQDATGPDGVANGAYTLTDDNSTGTGQVFLQESVTVSTSTQYTFSVYAKADQLNYLLLHLVGFTTPSNAAKAWFNLSSGSVGTVDATIDSTTMEDCGGGWYRCSVTFTTDASDTSGNPRLYVAEVDGATDVNAIIDQDGTSSILIYGAQIEVGSKPSSYYPVTSGTRSAQTLTSAGSNMAASTSAMSFHVQGEINYGDEGVTEQETFWRWQTDASNYLSVDLDTDSTDTGEVNANQADGGTVDTVTSDSYSPGVNVAFNIASRHTSGAINLAVDGTAVTEDATPTTLNDASGDTFELGYDFNGTFALLRQNDSDWADAGLEEASS